MKLSIGEFAELTGVSIRTLHYYDEIGLLKPSSIDTNSGYRYYNEDSLDRMQEILFYRELDFPLKSISSILLSPEYDRDNALKAQKALLILKKQRLERIIEALDRHQKGESLMKAFDHRDYDAACKKYQEEAKEKWGKTAAYKEYEEKAKGHSKDTYNHILAGMETILAKFSACMKNNNESCSVETQGLVKELQDYITSNFYTCTNEILAGLGKMYVADERFKNNIDKHGPGTAEYLSKAIAEYCKSNVE